MKKRQKLSLRQFKDDARGGSLPESFCIPKSYTTEVKAEGDERTLDFTITTGAVDRSQDTVNPNGAVNLATFPKTGVVLWAHDASLPPIAQPLDARVVGDSIKSRAKFAPADLPHPLGMGFGDTVRRMFLEKLLKSVSIGFMPIKFSFNPDRDFFAIDFEEFELLEFSPVPIPSNREALVDLAHKGFDMGGIYKWAGVCLDGEYDLIVPREYVENAREGLREVYGKGETTIDMGSLAGEVVRQIGARLKGDDDETIVPATEPTEDPIVPDPPTVDGETVAKPEETDPEHAAVTNEDTDVDTDTDEDADVDPAPEGDPELDDAGGLFDDPEKAEIARLIKAGEFNKAHEMIGALLEKTNQENSIDDLVLVLEETPEVVEMFDGNADDLREIVRSAIGQVMVQHTGRLPD